MLRARAAILSQVALGILLVSLVSVCAGQERPQAKGRPAGLPSGVFLLLEDLDQLLSLGRGNDGPVLLLGQEAQSYLRSLQGRAAAPTDQVRAQQCVIQGEVQGRLARLSLQIVAVSKSSEQVPLPLGLEGTWIEQATVDGQPMLAARAADQNGLVAWLQGQGTHRIELQVVAQLRGSKTLPSLVFDLPGALVSRLELKLDRPAAASSVKLVPAAPVTVEPQGPSGCVVRAPLGPRKKLELRWRWADAADTADKPVVRAVSEVVATVMPGVVEMQTELRLPVLVGQQQSWHLWASAKEQIRQVQSTDGANLDWDSRMADGRQQLTVTLPEPVKSGGSAKLRVRSEVPWSGNRAAISGLEVAGAFSHRSVVAVRSGLDRDVVVEALNVRPIEDASELPATLRSADNVGAFLAFAQPFQLRLRIIRRHPAIVTRTTTALCFEADRVTLLQQWRFNVQGGRVSQAAIVLPEGFEPADLIHTDDVQAVSSEVETEQGQRLGRVYLRGPRDSFELGLQKSLALPAQSSVARLELPWPLDARGESIRLYIQAPAHTLIQPHPELKPAEQPLDSDLAARLGLVPERLRGYQSYGVLKHLELHIRRVVPEVQYQANAVVRIESDRVNVDTTFTYAAPDGPVAQLSLRVPDSVRPRLSVVQSPGKALPQAEAGVLAFRPEANQQGPWRVQLRYFVPLDARGGAGGVNSVAVPLVQPLGAACREQTVEIVRPATMDVTVSERGWSVVSEQSGFMGAGASEPVGRTVVRRFRPAARLPLQLRFRPPAPQPLIVADRVLIQTEVGRHGRWRTRSRYHIVSVLRGQLGQVQLQVPAGGRLENVWLGSQRLPLSRVGDRRMAVELAVATVPQILTIDSAGSGLDFTRLWRQVRWEAPQLLTDLSLGQVLWQISMPDRVLVLANDSAYDSHDRWGWGLIGLGRASAASGAELERWLTGQPAAGGPADVGGSRSHLYGQAASLPPLELVVSYGPLLVLGCSGLVLLVGVTLVSVPLRGKRWLVFALAAAALAFAVWQVNLAVQCMQASLWGLMLVLVAGTIQGRLLRRAERRRSVFPEPAMLAASAGSSASAPALTDREQGPAPGPGSSAPPSPLTASSHSR